VRVEQLREEFEVEFDPYAYDLKPGLPPEGLPREQVYAGRAYPSGYIDNMRKMARQSGIEMKRPGLIPNTRKAHEATEYAREGRRLWEFHRAAFKAYWEDERNIGDVEVLADVAAGCGLDADGLREALAGGRYGDRVREQVEWGRAAGITGVPTVVFNERFAVVGAQDYEVFADIARRIVSGRLKAEG
jgi:predicted DsbA family dithiol-disulfide isomerase